MILMANIQIIIFVIIIDTLYMVSYLLITTMLWRAQ